MFGNRGISYVCLGEIPYIWAKYDNYNAIENKEILALSPINNNH